MEGKFHVSVNENKVIITGIKFVLKTALMEEVKFQILNNEFFNSIFKKKSGKENYSS